jgi:hypothetical protein
MKLLLSVIALAFASPALAQNAPAAQHAGHANHAAQPGSPAPAIPAAPVACTAEHAAMGHCKPSQSGPAAPAGRGTAEGHDADCCKKDANGKMACCEKAHAAGKDCCDEDGGATQGAHSDHAGH